MAKSSGAPRRILILGGTSEARELATLLVNAGHHVTTSLAGRTSHPAMPRGHVRIGGFGGVDGIVSYLASNRVEMIADATHPFAVQISRNGSEAARQCGIEYLRIERPPWSPGRGDRWIFVSSVIEAASAVSSGSRVLLTIGRKEIEPFLRRQDLSGIIRTIEKPQGEIPSRWLLIEARPPFTVAEELDLMGRHEIDCLVTKNAGGAATAAKLSAASQLAIGVVMVNRPARPSARTAESAAALMELIG